MMFFPALEVAWLTGGWGPAGIRFLEALGERDATGKEGPDRRYARLDGTMVRLPASPATTP
jgi:hypothetical protein